MKTLKRCHTHFLGWDRPLLVTAVDWLWQHCPPQGDRRLSDLLVVLPARRATRRLRQLLSQRGEAANVAWRLPQIITIGELPDYLYHRDKNVRLADEIERTLAWADVLRHTPAATLTTLFPTLPPKDSFTAWMELASTLRRLHEDLAANQLTFRDVAGELADDQPLQNERVRWQTLHRLHQQYLDALTQAGRTDRWQAQHEAVQQGCCHCRREVVLIGTADISAALAAMLRQLVSGNVSDTNLDTVTALVAADEAYRDHFDPFGTIIASRWSQWRLPLRDDQLVSASDVTDQATAAAAWVASQRATPDAASIAQVTLGVTNEDLIPPLEFEMRQIGVASYREIGWTLSQTPVGRLLELLTAHITQQSWQSLAALVRHADIYDWIDRQEAQAGEDQTGSGRRQQHWLTQLDELLANHYPTRLSISLPDTAQKKYPQAVWVARWLQESLGDSSADSSAPLSDWAKKLAGWLQQIYPQEIVIAAAAAATADVPADNQDGNSDGDPDAQFDEETLQEPDTPPQHRARVAVRACWRSLLRLAELDGVFDVSVGAATGLDLITRRLLAQRIGDVAGDDKLTIAGWLDLALDDSPALAVVGLNHPYVPEAITSDAFLPGDLRTRLQMSDNQRRLGRDIYALQLILATRDQVQLIVGRSGADGSPTPPSRLLAAAAPEDVAKRVVRLLQNDSLQQRQIADRAIGRKWDTVRSQTDFPIPVVGADFDVQRDLGVMSVTSFSAYMDCPYRFYLRHVLKLRPLDDSQRELAANQFGDLIHNSLESFGKSADKDSDDPQRVLAAMSDALSTFARDYYGSSPAAAVRLQIAQGHKRLVGVADQQVQRRRLGWQIYQVEASVGERNHAAVMADGQPMPIRGRFDRIDRHESLDRWAILDYKTHGHPPRKKHIQMVDGVADWVDLQLPIYRLMIPFLLGSIVNPETVELGYFNISDKGDETKINIADFTPTEFAAADVKIEEIVRNIRAGHFEPSSDVMYDDYAMILQAENAQQMFAASEGGEMVGDGSLTESTR